MSRKEKGIKQLRKWSIDNVQHQHFSSGTQVLTITCLVHLLMTFEDPSEKYDSSQHKQHYQSNEPIKKHGQVGK